jgi:membrane protein
MAWVRAKAVAAELALADSGATEMAFYLALSLVPLVGVTIALVSRWLPLDLSASIEEVLRGVLPAASHVAPGEVLGWARSSASQGWLTVGFVVALWTSFRFMSVCMRSLGTMVSTEVRRPVKAWRSAARSLLLLVVWTALFLLVAPAIERGLLRLPKLSELSLSAFAALRALLIVAVLFGAIYLTYRVVIGTRASRLRVALAALLASLGWIGASRGFSLAVPVLWKAAQLYGTLGSVVLFLIWAYVMAWVLLLGGFLLVRPDRPRAAGQERFPDRLLAR